MASLSINLTYTIDFKPEEMRVLLLALEGDELNEQDAAAANILAEQLRKNRGQHAENMARQLQK